MIELTCRSESPIEFVDETNRVVQLPREVEKYAVTFERISNPDRADIVVVTKDFLIAGTPLRCRTHISALDFFPTASATGISYTVARMQESFEPTLRYLVPLVEDVVVYSDGRDNSYIVVSNSAYSEPTTYRIRHKYYGADLAFFARITPSGSDSTIWARFNTHVTLESTGEAPPLEFGDHVWFPVPQWRVLWENGWTPRPNEDDPDGPPEWGRLAYPSLPRLVRVGS